MTSTPPTRQRSQRRDAQRNRARILEATREAFGERGLDVGVDEIARRAGVGMGTLYRHFPTKDALIDAIVDARFEQLTASAEEALTAPDAWYGLVGFLDAAVALQSTDRGFKDALAARSRDERGVKLARRRLHAALGRLVERAQAEGVLRADVTLEDVIVLLWATGRIVERAADVAPGAIRRFLQVHLAGLRPAAAQGDPLDVPPLTPRQIERATAPARRQKG